LEPQTVNGWQGWIAAGNVYLENIAGLAELGKAQLLQNLTVTAKSVVNDTVDLPKKAAKVAKKAVVATATAVGETAAAVVKPLVPTLAIVAVIGIVGAVLWLRGGLQPQAPLEALARRSPELGVALASGRPTIVEFYADWCEACRSMAPALEAVESRQRERLNVVLLNVDNPRWQPEIDRYAVNGIPHLELFNGQGVDVGRSIGARNRAVAPAVKLFCTSLRSRGCAGGSSVSIHCSTVRSSTRSAMFGRSCAYSAQRRGSRLMRWRSCSMSRGRFSAMMYRACTAA
jgi:thiol-disulfide isomerase/thioredoxin